MTILKTAARVAAFVVLALVATGAQAQATRTWVSGVGDDANPCSRTAPCKTFAGAISKTASGGEISVLDPGGFGALTITKPITIDGLGQGGSILASSTNGISINMSAPLATDRVVIRGISIDGAGPTLGTNGIRILNAALVVVEDVAIRNFSSSGIDVAPTAASRVFVRDVSITNAVTGIRANSTAAAATVSVIETSIVGGTTGISSTGASAVVTLAESSIAHVGTAIATSAGGQVQSFGNNRFTGNTNASGPTSEIGEQ